MLPVSGIGEAGIGDYIAVIKKRAKLIAAFVIAIPLFVGLVVFIMRPVYRATVSILIEKAPPSVTKFDSSAQTFYYEEYYRTQCNILESRALAEAVFDKLELGKKREYSRLKDPVKRLQDNISVEPMRKSQIVSVHVDDRDPIMASTIANMLAKLYIRRDTEARSLTSKEAADWLDEQLAGIRKRVQDSESALNSYVEQNRIVAIPDIDKKTEGLFNDLVEKRLKLETDLAEVSKRYKEKHPKIVSLKAQLKDISERIDAETSNMLEINKKMVQYNLLKKEADSNKQVYDSVLQSAKEKSLSEKLEMSSFRIVDFAKPPLVPYSPKKMQSIIISVILSALLGVGVAFLLEYKDSTIRTADDVRLSLELPFLGYIPKVDKELKGDKGLTCHQSPKSTVAESYRALRTSILFASPEDKPLKTVLVTSALPEEGKSFVTSNLAIMFSQIKERVVLLDLDMRKPVMHNIFNVRQDIGLSDYLVGKADANTIIKRTSLDNLSIITSGSIPHNPSELITSGKLRTLLETLASSFDRIVVDSPPVLLVADAVLIANVVDGVIWVVRSGLVRLNEIYEAKEKMAEAKGKIVGVVVNGVDIEVQGYQRYRQYHSETGQADSGAPAGT